MVSFQYVDFYDVPRTLVVSYKGELFLLQSAFDKARDEYTNEYTVYRLPKSVATQLSSGSWRFLQEILPNALGEIPIKSVQFDSSKRSKLDARILDKFIS